MGYVTAGAVMAQRVHRFPRRPGAAHVRNRRHAAKEMCCRKDWLQNAVVVSVTFEIRFLEVERPVSKLCGSPRVSVCVPWPTVAQLVINHSRLLKRLFGNIVREQVALGLNVGTHRTDRLESKVVLLWS